MAETPEQYRKRVLRSKTQYWDGIPVTGYRAICIHCGEKNRVQKRWVTMTCGACGKQGPVFDDKRAKEVLASYRGQKVTSGQSQPGKMFIYIGLGMFFLILIQSCIQY